MNIDILIRTCSKTSKDRYINAPKAEIMLRTIYSVTRTIAHALPRYPLLTFKLHIIDDHSDSETLSVVHTLLSHAPCETVFVPMERSGQSASIGFVIDYALEHCTGLMYFIEDDYIHEEHALDEMLFAYFDFSEKLGRSVIISPCDHAVEYRPPDVNTRGECRIVLGKSLHWRTTRGTTTTYLVDQRIFRTYLSLYYAHAAYEFDMTATENGTFNKIYWIENCFSPIPSLTAHLGVEYIEPPCVDYRRLWNELDYRQALPEHATGSPVPSLES